MWVDPLAQKLFQKGDHNNKIIKYFPDHFQVFLSFRKELDNIQGDAEEIHSKHSCVWELNNWDNSIKILPMEFLHKVADACVMRMRWTMMIVMEFMVN